MGFDEGIVQLHGSGWLATDAGGARYARFDGHSTSPTAELIATPLGWVGRSWRMSPTRTAVFESGWDIAWAVMMLELAEQAGQSSASWAPLEDHGSPSGAEGLHAFHQPGHPGRWGKMLDGRYFTYIERPIHGGQSQFMAAVDGIVVTRNGAVRVFESLAMAIYNMEKEGDDV
jgi:hypothetical protein